MPEDANTIKLWLWKDAPEEYKRLSGHGGDEDYVLLIPPAVLKTKGGNALLSALTSYHTSLGWPEEHRLEDGSVLIIFAHA